VRELKELKQKRDPKKVESALRALTAAAEKTGADRPNMMPFLLDASRAYCTLGEIREAMVAVHGEYREPAVF
jgi:methylmalonyl-CoA mutase N-terminal domain/subunit